MHLAYPRSGILDLHDMGGWMDGWMDGATLLIA